MFKKTVMALCCTAGLLMSSSQAAKPFVMQMGSGYDFELPAKKSQIFSNPFVWDATATCTILENKDTTDFAISFKVTRKRGTLNGVKMSSGDTAQLILHAKDKIKITGAPGAEMALTNIGEYAIRAECIIS